MYHQQKHTRIIFKEASFGCYNNLPKKGLLTDMGGVLSWKVDITRLSSSHSWLLCKLHGEQQMWMYVHSHYVATGYF